MFGMSGTELIIILALVLLLFGPDKLPEMAKMIGKGMREFQKATDDVRSSVEKEFYKLQQEADRTDEAAKSAPNAGTVATPPHSTEPSLLPPAATPPSAVATLNTASASSTSSSTSTSVAVVDSVEAEAAPKVGSDADLGAKVVSLESWTNKSEGGNSSS
jgi:sec-independent protein translocase protein TatB